MPKDYSKEERRSLRPPPPVSAVAMMAQSQGASRWVGGPVPPNSFDYQTKNTTNSQRPRRPGAANRVPPEIALKISKHLDIRDLARAALVWRPATEATYASPQFIMSECGRFSLMTNNMLAWPPEVMRSVRERIAQYNFAWSTLQYTSGKFFSIPETTEETPWAGSFGWKSGNRFMGESNGHLYDVGSWMAPGPSTGLQMWARVCLYQVPSLRTGQTELIRRQFNVALMSHYVKAVCVDPFAQLVAILEYNNHNTDNPRSQLAHLHVYHLHDGRHVTTTKLWVGFQLGAEVYHMELYGEMVAIVAHYPNYNQTSSDIHVQNWSGALRLVSIPGNAPRYITGFQFITEDLFIVSMKAKEDSRDQIPSNLVWVKHIRRNLECPIKFTDPASEGWTPNNISLIRNISPYQPTNGIFSSDPDKRLFGLRYDYFGFKNDIRSSACLFGRTTVESWLGICEVATPERTHVHWAVMALLPSDKDTPIELQLHPRKYDPTNREGTAIIGRRLFWSHISPSGWGLNSLDYNPGAGIHICPDVQARGKLWQSYTSFYCKDPKTVSYSCTTRINGVNRIIPTEDGLLIKKDDPGPPTFMALLM